MFGNSDNYGRNILFLKGDGVIKFVFIYDFVLMKVDFVGILRIIKWKVLLEVGGIYDFVGIVDILFDLVLKEMLLKELVIIVSKCVGLK